jgi:hypothetical protein
MEARRPPEYVLDIVADRTNVKDVVKGTWHSFVHRPTLDTNPTIPRQRQVIEPNR